MGKPIGPRKVQRYSNEFKVQAVRLSLHPDIQTQDVAKALDSHPFMLSRWKKDWREGRLKASAGLPRLELPRPAEPNEELGALKKQVRGLERRVEGQPRVRTLERKVNSLQRRVEAQTKVRGLERRLRALEIENDLLKKAIRFNLEHRRRSSSS